MQLRKRISSGMMLAEALVGLAVALALLMGLCTMLQQWRRDASALEARGRLLDAAARVMRAASREDFEGLDACAADAAQATTWAVKAARIDPASLRLTAQVTRTDDPDVLAVRVEVREDKASPTAIRDACVVLERLVARPEASLRMEGVQ